MWHVETFSVVTGRWHTLVVDQKMYCQGVFDGMTNFQPTSTHIRLYDGKGALIKEHIGGTTRADGLYRPNPPAAWEEFAMKLAKEAKNA